MVTFPLKTPVIVRSPNWLGDAIMALPAIRNLKTLIGQETLGVAAPAKIADLWKAFPFVDQVIPLEQPRNIWKTVSALREGSWETALLFPNSIRSGLEARAARIKSVIGYRGFGRDWLLTQSIVPSRYEHSRQHQVFHYLDLASAVGAPEDETFPDVVKPLLPRKEKQLAVCPGAEYGPSKRWPAASFAEVARRFHEERGAEVVLFGAAKDQAVGREIKALAPFVEDRTGQTTLAELMNELAVSRLAISNDSGAMHLASALGTPTVAIFGSTEPRRTGPLGPKTKVLRHHVPCSPCYLRTCPLDFACMLSLTPDLVAAACGELWDSTS